MKDKEYEELQRRIEEDNKKYEEKTKRDRSARQEKTTNTGSRDRSFAEQARDRILEEKRNERSEIRNQGGGFNLANRVYGRSTDFEFGANVETSPSIPASSDGPGGDDVRCMGRVACQICKKFHGYCVEIEEDKEKLKMLPTGDDGNNRRQAPRAGGLNFINNPDLTTQPQEAKILMVKFTEKGKQGPSITLKLAFKNEIRFLWVPCRKTDNRYSALITAFGANENEWVDERINIYLEQDDFSGNYRQAVSVPEKITPKKGGR